MKDSEQLTEATSINRAAETREREHQRGRLSALVGQLTRQEWALIGIVLLGYAYFFAPTGTNPLSRYDMVRALAHGTAVIDPYAANTIDVSIFAGHYYSPRSIGLSLVAVPVLKVMEAAYALLGLSPQTAVRIGYLTLFTVVPVSLAGVIAFERFVMRLRPQLAGTPLPVVLAGIFGLGTLYGLFATQFFSHTFAGGLVFVAFYLLYRARTARRAEMLALAAGVLVGLAVISEYPTALVALLFCGYVWAAFPGRRMRMLLCFCGGAAPWALVLGWYDWFAFGNPLHLSYDYVAGGKFSGQHQGLFGITWPRPGAYWEILVWPRGLLVESPFLALVPLGFYRWWRSSARPPLEALLCLAVVVVYTSLVASYFLPMAGENLPGPRLLAPMLPFACLALVWVVDDARRWLRTVFAALAAFGLVVSFWWVALGVREYHAYPTYPVVDLFWHVLITGESPHENGATPPNLGTEWLHLPHAVSFWLAFVPLLLWTAWAVRAIVTHQEGGAQERAMDIPSTEATTAPARSS